PDARQPGGYYALDRRAAASAAGRGRLKSEHLTLPASQLAAYVRWQLATTPWLPGPGEARVAPQQVLLAPRGQRDGEFSPILHSARPSLDLLRQRQVGDREARALLASLGVNQAVSDLPPDLLYQLLLSLPERDQAGERASSLYRELVVGYEVRDELEDDPARLYFLQHGQLTTDLRVMHTLPGTPADEERYASFAYLLPPGRRQAWVVVPAEEELATLRQLPRFQAALAEILVTVLEAETLRDPLLSLLGTLPTQRTEWLAQRRGVAEVDLESELAQAQQVLSLPTEDRQLFWRHLAVVFRPANRAAKHLPARPGEWPAWLKLAFGPKNVAATQRGLKQLHPGPSWAIEELAALWQLLQALQLAPASYNNRAPHPADFRPLFQLQFEETKSRYEPHFEQLLYQRLRAAPVRQQQRFEQLVLAYRTLQLPLAVPAKFAVEAYLFQVVAQSWEVKLSSPAPVPHLDLLEQGLLAKTEFALTGALGEALACEALRRRPGVIRVEIHSENAARLGELAGAAGLGYDLLYVDEHGQHYVEVKSSLVAGHRQFFITQAEAAFGERHADQYELLLVTGLREASGPRYESLGNPFRYKPGQDFLHNDSFSPYGTLPAPVRGAPQSQRPPAGKFPPVGGSQPQLLAGVVLAHVVEAGVAANHGTGLMLGLVHNFRVGYKDAQGYKDRSRRAVGGAGPQPGLQRAHRTGRQLGRIINGLFLASVKAGACLMRVFFSRAIPLSSTFSLWSVVGEVKPASSWALAMAAAWRWMVATFLPASASSVRKPASASTEAGRLSIAWAYHQAVNRRQSPA
nr:hypothetical protein [Tanacetum cinerariifolium]